MYQNEATNFSNVNMLAIALATIGRIETDPSVRTDFEDLVDAFWGGADSRSAVHDEQPWFGYGFSVILGPGGEVLAGAKSLYGSEIVYATIPTAWAR